MNRNDIRRLYASHGVELAFTDERNSVCPGGQPLTECDTTAPMVQAASEWQGQPQDEGRMWNTLLWLGKSCTTCTKTCEVAAETEEGQPTGLVRVSSMARTPTPVRIIVDTNSYRGIQRRKQ